jgi:hypothetical protein
MDMLRSEVRKLATDDYTTREHLAHASQQARERNYQDFLIVDVDAHHYESESYREVFEFIESPVVRRQAVESAKRGGRSSMLGGQIGYQDIGGRITRHELRKHDIRRHDKLASEHHRDVRMTLEWMDAIGVDWLPCCSRRPCCFSACIPGRGRNGDVPRLQSGLCEAHPLPPSRASFHALPSVQDPEAAYRTVMDSGDKRGVVGFMGDIAALQARPTMPM